MELFVDDAGFVRAPASLVYRRLTDVGSWPRWWRGVTVRRNVPPGDADRWMIGWRVGPTLLRVDATFHGWRHDTGVVIDLHGDVTGEAEFWLEPNAGGTVVHHLFVGRTDLLRGRRVHETYRRAMRRGLWGLKDALHLEVRTMAGLVP